MARVRPPDKFRRRVPVQILKCAPRVFRTLNRCVENHSTPNQNMKSVNTRPSLLPPLALAWGIGLPLSSLGANLVVTSLADSGSGSLREAIDLANADADADVITFDAAFSGQNISLTSQLVLSNAVTIDAFGLAGGLGIINPTSTSISSANLRIFEISPNSIVELNNLRIVGGYVVGIVPPEDGGGILARGPGTLTLNHCTLSLNCTDRNGGAIAVAGSALALTLNRCTITRNIARSGGGIHIGGGGTTIINECTISENGATHEGGGVNGGAVTINNSTIYDNFARFRGGGVRGANPVRLHNSTLFGNSALHGAGISLLTGSSSMVNNATISGNHAVIEAGGIFAPGVPMTNSIVAGNTAPTNSNVNFAGSTANNLIGGDPDLAPPGNYGGPTLTMPPLASSPAIDAGDDSVTNSLATDQRGFPRLAGAHVDIGAVERQVVSATNAPVLKLTFTSSPDTDFTMRAATNVALPAGQWDILGPPTQDSPGQYQFTDLFAPDYPQRFYQVISP